MGEKHKLIRLDVPMFDNNGKLLELAERRLDFMDVVAVQTKVFFTSRSRLLVLSSLLLVCPIITCANSTYAHHGLPVANDLNESFWVVPH